jgi:hypothetical protein
LNWSHAASADRSPNLLVVDDRHRRKRQHHLVACRPYLARKSAFFCMSRSAAKSSGASLGTDVTTPVPFVVLIDSIGSV